MLHERVSVRWRINAFLLGAGSGALLGSLIAWLAALAPLPHLLLTLAAAAVVGLLALWRRAPRRDRQALAWIGERVGLAYETAWNLEQRGPAGGPLAHALADATRVQGRLSIRDLQPPAVSAWWLPLATAATVLWLWAMVAGPPLPGLADLWGGAAPPADPAAVAPLDAASEAGLPAPEAEAFEVDPPEERGVAGPAPAGEAQAEGGGPPGVEGGTAEGGGQAAERDTFERFLERLRERPSEAPEGSASLAEGDDQGPDSDEAPLAATADEEGSSRDPAAGAGDQAPRGDAPGEEGGDEVLASDEGEVEAGDAPGEGGELGEGMADGEAPGESALGERDAGTAGEMPQEGAGLDAGEEATSNGGVGVGAPTATLEGVEGAEGLEPEALPSLLGPGPELPVGGVQLPGAAPEGTLPVGEGAVDYQRAVERALLEGDLPAPYQEVIRFYFR
jgi:hypothetical protein